MISFSSLKYFQMNPGLSIITNHSQWEEILYEEAFTISYNPTFTRLSSRSHAIYEVEEKYS